MNRKTSFAVVVVLSLLYAGLYFVTRPGEPTRADEPRRTDAGSVSRPDPDAGDDSNNDATVGFVDETAEGRTVRLVRDGSPVSGAGVVAGAPGSYPPELGETSEDGVFLVEHAATETFSGERVGWVELYAFEGETAAWSTFDLTATDQPDIELVAAHDLTVTVVRSSGVPAGGATVRLSRREVGLVSLEAVVDDDGQATFGPIPPGNYVITAEFPGFLTGVEAANVAKSDLEVILEVVPGARVTGRVLGADELPVSASVVAIYVDTGELQGVPRAIVSSDTEGRFVANGLPPGPTWAVASGAGAAPARSERIDTREGADELTIRLRPAVRVSARVLTESDEPVRDAVVSWTDESTGASSAAKTDETGRAAFHSVVPGAKLVASLSGWASREHVVTAEDAGKTIVLKLTRGEPPKRMRLAGLPGDVSRIRLMMVNGTACGVDSIDERDFWVTGCPDGDATLTIESESAGTATVPLKLGDGVEARLPERRRFAVRVNVSKPGVVPTADWSDGKGWRRFSLEQTDEDVWDGVAQLYPGTYMTRAAAPGHATEESSVQLGAQGFEGEVELEEKMRHEAFILDARRTPVTGARVEIWNGDKRVRIARSAGQLPVVVERPKGDGWYLLAIDPQRGERRVALDGARLEVELTKPVGSVSTPGRVPPQILAERDDIEMARDGEAWLFDPVPGTAVAKQLARGDRYVTARTAGGTIEVVVERSGQALTVRIE